MTIGGIFDGDELLEKTHQELVKLQHTSATPETIEDYYQASAKAVRKVGFSAIMALMIECSRTNSIIEVISFRCSYLKLLFGLLSLAPRSIAKQIQKQNNW